VNAQNRTAIDEVTKEQTKYLVSRLVYTMTDIYFAKKLDYGEEEYCVKCAVKVVTELR
jgi:hypothetical protein